MFLERGDLAIQGLVTVAGILQFAGCQKVIGLRGSKQSLRVAKKFSGIAQTIDGRLEGSKSALANKR